MSAITVRNIPDDVKEELAARAARSGRSLQEYLRSQLIELTATPDIHELLSRVRERKAATRSLLIGERILEHRDSERR